MTNIEGKVVAITGAGSGMGAATALLLAEGGAKLVLGGRREAQLLDVVARIEAAGGEAVAGPTDVTRRGDVEALVAAATARFGRLDVMIANAGIGPISAIDDLRVEDWEAMIDVNFRGVLYGVAAALPVFRAQGSGHFVNVLSTSGLKRILAQIEEAMAKIGISPDAIARAIAFAIEQPADVDVGEIVVRPTAQG